MKGKRMKRMGVWECGRIFWWIVDRKNMSIAIPQTGHP
jgi:hypothetical protein